jgi:hypothetical protein
MYGNIDRSTLNWEYYYMFNKFDDKEDCYYLKYICSPGKNIYGYIEITPLIKNYQYYESKVDKHIGLDFTKGREYNVVAVNNCYKQIPTNPKVKIEWGRLITMIINFEIGYGRYLNDTGKKFREADVNHEVLIPQEKTPIPIIEIEDETLEIPSERIDESNTVDINDMLQLSKIEIPTGKLFTLDLRILKIWNGLLIK